MATRYFYVSVDYSNGLSEYDGLAITNISDINVNITEVSSEDTWNAGLIEFELNGVTYPINAVRFSLFAYNNPTISGPSIPYDGSVDKSYNFGLFLDKYMGNYNGLDKLVIEVRLYDTWGNTSIDYLYLDAIKYTLPQISFLNVTRTTPSTSIEFEYSAEVTEISTVPSMINKMYYLFQYDNGGIWTDIGTLTQSMALEIMNNTYLSSDIWEEALSYSMRMKLYDKFNTVYAYDVLPTILVPLSIGKFGIGVGKTIENADAALDVNGKVYRDNILQPKIFSKKPADPDPDGMETGDLLIIYNDTEDFTSVNFPQEFGTGYVWAQAGVWPTDYLFWASTSSSNNPVVKSIEASGWKADMPPTVMFDGSTAWNNNTMMPYGALPVTVIMTFNGLVQFNSFTIHGWAQGHEPKNSPKSFSFFGSLDGHEWINLYYTIAFPDTYNTSAGDVMTNSGLYFKYLKMVWISNQNDNNEADLTNATMISLRELIFDASGVKYV